MNDENHGNVAPVPARETEPHVQRSVFAHGKEIDDDVRALAAAVQDAGDDLKRYLTQQVQERPYTTLGLAAGAGFILGGGLRSKLTAVLFGSARRLVTAVVVRELGARILQSSSASVQTTAPEQSSGATKEQS